MGGESIKIFGVERTCTNYVKELIEVNTSSEVWVNKFGGKHSLVDPEGWLLSGNWDCMNIYKTKKARFVICVKDPYHWLVSVRNYRDPFYFDYDPEHLLKRFEKLNLNWHLELIENKHPFFSQGCVIKYEDLLTDPKKTLEKTGLLITEFKDLEKVKHSAKFNPERKNYYLKPISDREIIENVNKYLSDEFFLKYGYERIG